jgi:hypothetical protein
LDFAEAGILIPDDPNRIATYPLLSLPAGEGVARKIKVLQTLIVIGGARMYNKGVIIS